MIIDKLKEKNKTFSFKIDENPNKKVIAYGNHTGVFKMLGINDEPHEDYGPTYISPEKIVIRELIDEITKEKISQEEYFDKISDYIVNNSIKELDLYKKEDEKNLFVYVIREMIRNIFDHSETEHFYYASQIYPKLNKVEVVLADVGLGLRETIPFDAEEKFYELNTDEKAIRKAMSAGVTAGSNHSYASDSYKNSGYGLAMVKEILQRSNGVFSLASGNKTIQFENDNEILEDCDLKGTIVRLKINLELLKKVDFEDVTNVTYNAAKESGFNHEPSSASRTLKSTDLY